MNYWHLELYSGEIIKVKPETDTIQTIQRLIASQQGAITTPTRSIVIKDVRDFRLSDELYTDQKLLEDANTAVNQPTLTESGAIKARWVKKSVPARRWYSFFRFNPVYKLLDEAHDSVTLAFVLPVHLIDHNRVQELSPNDEIQLSKIMV